MSTILKALRRLEEDDSRKPAAPLAADESLRNRILAEESAAAAAGVHDPDPGSRSDHRSGSFRRLAPAGRTLTTIALLLFLAFFVGLAGWYWIRDPAPPEPALATAPASPSSPAGSPVRSLAAAESPDSAPSGSPISPIPAVGAAAMVAAAEIAPPTAARAPTSLADPAPAGRRVGRSSASPSQSPSPPAPAPAPARASAAVAAPSPVPRPPREEDLPAVASRRATAVSPPPSPSRTRLPSPERRPAPNAQPEPAAARPSSPSIQVARNEPAVAPAPEAPTAAPRSSESKSSEAGRSEPSAVPDIAVLQIAWHPQSDRRSTRIRVAASEEVLTLREGDAIGRLVVQEISPSAVVFALGDVEVRRRVGHGVP